MFINKEALKAAIKQHLSTSLKPKPKPRPKLEKSRYSIEQERARVLEMVRNIIRESIPKMLKSIDIDRIIIEKLEAIDWKEKAKETADLALKEIRGIVA